MCGQGVLPSRKIQWCWTVMGDSSFLSPFIEEGFLEEGEVKQAEEDQEEKEGKVEEESQSKGKKEASWHCFLGIRKQRRLLGRGAKIKATGD